MKKILSLLLVVVLLFLVFTACDFAIPSEENSNQSPAPNNDKTTDVSPDSSDNSAVSTSLSAIECSTELTKVLEKSKAQKTVRFEEDGWVYAYYFDGTNSFVYTGGGEDGNWNEMWYGRSGNDYLCFNKSTTSSGITKTCEVISKSDVEEFIEYINGNIFEEYLEDAVISEIATATSFECIKSIGKTTVYQIKATIDGFVQNITVNTADGLVTKISIENYTTVNYTYDTTITLPNKNDYPSSQELSLFQCKNELNTILEKSKAQKTVRFEEDDWVYAYYFDGTNDFAYFSGGKDGYWNEKWYGKLGSNYVYFKKYTTLNGTQKTYDIISESTIDNYIENVNDEIFQYLEYDLIDFLGEAIYFAGYKSVADATTYYIEAADGYVTREFTVTVVDGLLTDIVLIEDGDPCASATYDYSTPITLPNINEYTLN